MYKCQVMAANEIEFGLKNREFFNMRNISREGVGKLSTQLSGLLIQ